MYTCTPLTRCWRVGARTDGREFRRQRPDEVDAVPQKLLRRSSGAVRPLRSLAPVGKGKRESRCDAGLRCARRVPASRPGTRTVAHCRATPTLRELPSVNISDVQHFHVTGLLRRIGVGGQWALRDDRTTAERGLDSKKLEADRARVGGGHHGTTKRRVDRAQQRVRRVPEEAGRIPRAARVGASPFPFPSSLPFPPRALRIDFCLTSHHVP